MRSRTLTIAVFCLLIAAPPALAAFPYPAPAPGDDYTDLRVGNQVPSDIGGDSNEFKYAATPSPGNAFVNPYPTELGGVRGAHVADAVDSAETAWETTTGRPDVSIAVLDSGIKWDDDGAMNDLRFKTRLNGGELPAPQRDNLATPNEPGTNCTAGGPFTHTGDDDLNGDGVFNLRDFACDSRVSPNPANNVNTNLFEPQDLLIAFGNQGADSDANGYVDDIVGWDFLDNDNDPYDDVQYGHGTGEASGSTSEADNGNNAGSCPNCMVVHMRVGDSFIADINRFATAVTYAVDNRVLVVQSALGTLNNSSLARDAVEYAYDHGVAVVVSAADEAAQHNNQPYLPKTILVNSVTRSPLPEPDRSYLMFNGCTNFNAKITLAIPSTSCSSDAVGVGSGLAGLIISAALNARDKGALAGLDPHPTCELTFDGPDAGSAPDPCPITPNEVRQVMATATVNGVPVVDDVDFVGLGGPNGPEPNCISAPPAPPPPAPPPACTDPNGPVSASAVLNRGAPIAPPPLFSYPARDGHDQFYGYGRANTNRSVKALMSDPETPAPAKMPPEVEITSPEWNEQLSPDQPSIEIQGEVWARGDSYTCQVLVAPGHYPDDDTAPDGDFRPVPGGACNNGGTARTTPLNGSLASIPVGTLKSYFPPDTQNSPQTANFHGRENGPTGQTASGRPATEPYGFVVKVVASVERGGVPVTGEDRRAAYLHRDQDMLAGYPKAIRAGGAITSQPATPTGDGESSPAFADLDGDNDNELIFAGSDGFVHAMRPDGSELAGWPVRTDAPDIVAAHMASRAYASGEVSTNLGGAVLASVAVGDTNDDGVPEVYAGDLEGKLYGWRADGTQVFEVESNPAFSGKPLTPFVNVRRGETNRTQHGFFASPVLADLDLNGRDEIIAPAMDRHVYAWHRNGSQVAGFPTLVVDESKVDSIDPITHRVTFAANAGSEQQGAIIDTPAVGDLDGDANTTGPDELPEIVVGTNEEYRAAEDGGFNAAAANSSSFNLLTQAQTAIDAFKTEFDECGPLKPACDPVEVPLNPGNARLYAINATGDPDAPLAGEDPFRTGWPAKLGIAMTGLLPVVGEGVTGNPIIASVACAGLPSPRVGAVANNGPAYILNENGRSCYGRDPQGRDIPLQTDGYVNQPDHPMLPAVGHPAFVDLGGVGPSFVMPAAGITRALDLAFPEYQRGGQDFLSAWTVESGQFRPGFPTVMNDLQFLTGPSGADIDNLPGEELVAGSASKDLQAYNALGQPANTTWPKVTTDWTVANPLIGSFGTVDTEADANKVVIGLTRSGYLNAYATDAPACSPSSWPRFHHDNANSGDYSRDAVLPGRPSDAAVTGTSMSFKAPGDDLLCGTATTYEAVTSDAPITPANFDDADPLASEPTPGAAGSAQTYPLTVAKRYVAIRAVDEQGNVGRPAVVDRGADAAPIGPADPTRPDSPTDPTTPTDPDGPTIPGPGIGACSNPINGSTGKDRIAGTRGPDRIKGFAGADRLNGGEGNDCVSGQGGRDRLSGDAGNDELRGGRGRDRLRGGDGDDEIRARRGGRDRIDCGPGDDTVYLTKRFDRARNCETVKRG